MTILISLFDLIDDRQNLTLALFTTCFLAPVVAVVAGFVA